MRNFFKILFVTALISMVSFAFAQDILLTEDFESGVMPEGWSMTTNSAQGWWITQDGSSAYWAIPAGDGFYACANDDMANDDGSVDYLLTPATDYTGYSTITLNLSSYFTGEYSQTAHIVVDVGNGWENVYDLEVAAAWTDLSIDISEVLAGETNAVIGFHANDNGAWAAGWAVDNVSVEAFAMVATDITVMDLTGSTTPTVDVASDYILTIKNMGTDAQDTYDVSLMDANGAIVTVAGPVLASGEQADILLTWTPATEGETVIWGEVTLTGDEYPNNNLSDEMVVNVQPAGLALVVVGDGTEELNYMPVNYYYLNSLVEQIYFAEELQIGGVLTAMEFYYNFFDIPAVPDLKIWIGETTLTDLSAGFIPSTELTLVYDGAPTYNVGEGTILLTLDTPYVYSGGNLVVLANRPMDTAYYSSQDYFYSTITDYENRTVYKYSDSEEYDHTQAYTDGTLSNTHTNCGFYFIYDGGAITGTITEDGAPLAGVEVAIDGTPAVAVTNANGIYDFAYVAAGTASLTALLFGYEDAVVTDVIVVEDETTTVDFEMIQLPTVAVSGSVFGSDYPEIGIEGAEVVLTGYEEYEAVTDVDGMFVVVGVYTGHTYNLEISADGYDTFVGTVEVLEEVVMEPIILNEVAIPAGNVVATPNPEYTEVEVVWNAPGGGSAMEFRYDDGIVTGQLGFGANPSSVLGGSHPNVAVINEVAWYLTSESAHAEAIIYIFGLDAAGVPDTGQLLHESTPQPNIDDAWNTYVLPEAIDAENGFFVGVCTPNIFTAIGIDDGVDEPYVFTEGNQWGIADWTAGNDWLDVGPAGFPNNFLIRAYGLDLGEIEFTGNRSIVAKHKISGVNGSELVTSVDTGAPKYSNFAKVIENDRILETYKIHRFLLEDEENPEIWTLLAELSDTTYIDLDFINCAAGSYKYAVTAIYTNGLEAEVAFSNVVENGVMGTATFNITTNDGISAEGAVVTFTAQSGGHIYEGVADATGVVVITDVWFETYDLLVTLDGYEYYTENNLIFETDATFDAQLIELLIPVTGLDATVDGATVTLNWGSVVGDEFAEDFESGTLPEGWLALDEDGDGFNWVNTIEQGFDFDAYEGAGAMTSASYDNDAGALTPDNWLISPAITIGSSSVLSYWHDAQDAAWSDEYYYVKVSTTGPSPSDFTDVVWEGVTPGDWAEVTVDLSAYAGEAVFLAFQHTDVTDMFWMKLDNVVVTNAERAERELLNYIVMRNGVPLAEDYTETTYVDVDVPTGTHTYGVAVVYTTGVSDFVEIDVEIAPGGAEDNEIPNLTVLNGNYPNPFNGSTKINFSLKETSNVTINIYNAKGQLVRTLSEEKDAGYNKSIVWDGRDNNNKSVSSGMYFYKMKSNGRYTSTKKMILLK